MRKREQEKLKAAKEKYEEAQAAYVSEYVIADVLAPAVLRYGRSRSLLIRCIGGATEEG
jgi:hypothetical protein